MPAALGVVLALALSVSLSVSVLVLGGLGGRARGQDVIAHVVEDAEQTGGVSVRPARLRRRRAAPPTHLRSASGALFSSSLPGKSV